MKQLHNTNIINNYSNNAIVMPTLKSANIDNYFGGDFTETLS